MRVGVLSEFKMMFLRIFEKAVRRASCASCKLCITHRHRRGRCDARAVHISMLGVLVISML